MTSDSLHIQLTEIILVFPELWRLYQNNPYPHKEEMIIICVILKLNACLLFSMTHISIGWLTGKSTIFSWECTTHPMRVSSANSLHEKITQSDSYSFPKVILDITREKFWYFCQVELQQTQSSFHNMFLHWKIKVLWGEVLPILTL